MFKEYFSKYVALKESFPVRLIDVEDNKIYCPYCKQELKPVGPGSKCDCQDSLRIEDAIKESQMITEEYKNKLEAVKAKVSDCMRNSFIRDFLWYKYSVDEKAQFFAEAEKEGF